MCNTLVSNPAKKTNRCYKLFKKKNPSLHPVAHIQEERKREPGYRSSFFSFLFIYEVMMTEVSSNHPRNTHNMLKKMEYVELFLKKSVLNMGKICT